MGRSKIAITLDEETLSAVDVFNQRSGTVIAVTLTTQPQRVGFPLTLESGSA